MKAPTRPKGKLVRGTNYDSKPLGTFEKAKIMDMFAQHEITANQ